MMARCKKGKCIVGNIAGDDCTAEEWSPRLERHKAVVEEFITSRKALPHPGHIHAFKFCTQCGCPN